MLVDELIEELDRRGIDFYCDTKEGCDEETPKMVLVSEVDSIYGRLFKNYLKEAIKRKKGNKDEKEFCDTDDVCTIIKVNYMRGLDGEIKDLSEVDGKADENAGQMKKNDEEEDSIERPHGNQQYDYLRRLGKSLKDKNEFLRNQHGKNYFPPEFKADIKAIGILGTDIYDKLLVLQALKKDFPEAVFFTTDLNSSLLHPEEYSTTRNLLVLSGFGLELHEKFQKGYPPFRENYQTGIFLASLMAFSKDDSSINSDFMKDPEKYLKPRIFEIGRTGAIDLSVKNEGGEYGSLHPPRKLPEDLGLKIMIYAALIISFCCALIFYPFKENSDFFHEYLYLAIWFFLIVFGFVIFHLEIFFAVAAGISSEPLFWWEGVSVWPTNFILMASILMAWTFILISVKRLDGIYKYIGETLNVSNGEDDAPKETGGFIERLCEDMTFSYFYKLKGVIGLNGDASIEPMEIWKAYRFHSSWKNKTIRLATGLLLILALFIFYNVFFNEIPDIPYRNYFSKYTTLFNIIFAVFSFFVLLLFVVDEIRLSNRFVKALKNYRISWDVNTLEKYKVYPEKWRETHGLSEIDDAAESLDIFCGNFVKVRLIARFTDVVDDLLYFPFIILFMMIVSHSSVFDSWNFPLPLILLLSTGFLVIFYFGFRLHRTAKTAKEMMIKEMNDEDIKMMGDISSSIPDSGREGFRNLTNKIISATESIREGAFVPIWEQPIIASILIPFSGVGGFALLEYLFIF